MHKYPNHGAVVLMVMVATACGCRMRMSASGSFVPPAPSEVLLAAPSAVQERFAPAPRSLTFPFNGAELQSKDEGRVTSLAALLLEIQHDFPEVIFLVEGHCDNTGTTDYNRALGLKRAKSIQQRLIASGLPPDHVRAASFGAELPVCTTHDQACRERNRRVEIRAVVRPSNSSE